jgi:chromosome segregation ATPase
VVTAPKDIQSDETDKFFRETYNFLSDRYGKDNVISAYVHMDEITPHMHFAFVPVVVDKKKGILKVSAKEAVTKKDLDMFHQHYSKYMESIFGRDIGVLNEATKEGNKSIDELKRGTAQKELAEMKRETEEVIKLKESEEKRLQEDKEQIESLKNEKVALKKEIGELEKIFKGKQLDREDLERIQPIENIFGSIKNVTVKDIQNLKKMAMTNLKDRTDLVNAQREIKRLSEDNTRLQGQIPTLMEKMEQAKKEAELTNKNQKLTNDYNFVVRKYNTLVQAIHQLPEAEQQFIREIVEPPKTEIKERDMGYEIGD